MEASCFTNIHKAQVANKWAEDCFQENTTLMFGTATIPLIQWFIDLNYASNKFGMNKLFRNSVPRTCTSAEEISGFFRTRIIGESVAWKSLKIVVLGDSQIGKSTLVHKIRSIFDSEYSKQVSSVLLCSRN